MNQGVVVVEIVEIVVGSKLRILETQIVGCGKLPRDAIASHM